MNMAKVLFELLLCSFVCLFAAMSREMGLAYLLLEKHGNLKVGARTGETSFHLPPKNNLEKKP